MDFAPLSCCQFNSLAGSLIICIYFIKVNGYKAFYHYFSKNRHLSRSSDKNPEQCCRFCPDRPVPLPRTAVLCGGVFLNLVLPDAIMQAKAPKFCKAEREGTP